MALLTSNANFAPTTLEGLRALHGGAFTMTLPGLHETVRAIGCDGVELMPIHSPKITEPFLNSLYAELQTISPARAQEYGGIIVAMHQSFVGMAHETPDPALRISSARQLTQPGSGLADRYLTPLIMPTGEASLAQLATIATKLGKEASMTCVVFPNQQGLVMKDLAQSSLFPGGALVQPTPDVLAAWGIHPASEPQPERLIEELRRRRYKVAAGFFHLYRKGKVVDFRIGEEGATEDAVSTYMEQLLAAEMVEEVHIELNRNDFAGIDPDWCKVSRQEAVALYNGGNALKSLPLGRRLEQLRDAKWTGNVVVELSAAGAIDAIKTIKTNKKVTKKDILDFHKTINGQLREELPFLKS